MGLAFVTCKGKGCGVLVKFGSEHYCDGKAYCDACYPGVREESTAKVLKKYAPVESKMPARKNPVPSIHEDPFERGWF